MSTQAQEIHGQTDRIQREVAIAAPVSRVWRALTDHREFGAWFGVEIDAPFEVGAQSRGTFTGSSCDAGRWTVRILAIEPEHLFAFSWHPFAVDSTRDYSGEEPTRVEIRLTPTAEGTRVTVTESGFDRIPVQRRAEAYRMNSYGWECQMENIKTYVANHP